MKRSVWLNRVLLVTAALTVAGAAVAQVPKEGRPISPFQMKDLNGKVHTDKSLRGRVVLIDFWATWCGPCKKASPVMQRLHTTYGSKGLTVIGANVEDSGSDATPLVQKYRKEHKYTYTFTVGNEKLSQAWGVEGIPTFYLIDKKGIVRKITVGVGPKWDTDLEAAIKSALK